MNGQIAWLVILTILTLAQALVLTLRLVNNRRNNRKDNPGHGEKIAILETKVENIEEDIKEIKGKLNRK